VPLHHSMTSVARARIIGDTVRPSVLAVLRLTTAAFHFMTSSARPTTLTSGASRYIYPTS
jgi:hypothetical protein